MIISAFFIGFVAAATHVLTGPDHLAAVTPLVVENKTDKNYRVGLFWGVGHVLGMLLIGVLFYFFKNMFNVEVFSAYSERFVGFILIGIGIWVIIKFLKPFSGHFHPHFHQINNKIIVHIHKHKHAQDKLNHDHEHAGKKIISPNEFSSLGIGILHGFAGVSHFILMLPVLGYRSTGESLIYMIGFAMGILFSMSVYAYLIGRLKEKEFFSSGRLKYFRLFAGLLAIFVGVAWIFVN